MPNNLPTLLYGTAWKEDETERCVVEALAAGFRGIDTANQRKHYHEAAVGMALAKTELRRDELFLQTKFTHLAGQDARLPYEAKASVSEQVTQSFAKSLEHLRVERIDSFVLHGPTQREGLSQDDRDAWRAMEQLVKNGRVTALGISNVSASQIVELVSFANIQPSFVQNRCYAKYGWDFEVRQLCEQHGLIYQAFSLLTANRHVLANSKIETIAKKYLKTKEQIIFRFAQQMRMLPLTGTTNREHMRLDLAISDVTLLPDELQVIEQSGMP